MRNSLFERSENEKEQKPSTGIYHFLLILTFVFLLNQNAEAVEQNESGNKAEAELKHLETLWKTWDSSVTSFELKGFRFVGLFEQKGTVFTHTEFEELVQNQMIPFIDKNEITLENLKSKLNITTPSGGYWRPFSIVMSADSLRIEDVIQGKTYTVVRNNGQESDYYEGQKQANVHGSYSGLISANRSNYLYQVPSSTFKGNVDYSCPQLNFCTMKSKTRLLKYNKETGFVYYYARRSLNGDYRSEKIQSNEIVSPKGVPVPRIIADASYFKNSPTIKVLDLFLFSHIEINPKLSPEIFQIAVPAGVNVVKFENAESYLPLSKGGKRPPMASAQKPISDIQKFSEQPGFGKKEKPASRAQPVNLENDRSSMVLILIIGNILFVFIIIGIMMYRKKTT
ncbi:hypothetical protein [Gimesia aquarii]|uniref:Uncharacterized protein n=1 Tax=Gimesia aquarii TaxID=2527964 RepID=A0A517W149_9PLAN|nr:hypothetical protein [Gimesia aquarii]QDT98983.1 hypothetical protein V144x_44930 [Gimesia aquarii]